MPVPFSSLHLFFLCYAIGEAILEIALLMLLSFVIARYCPRFVYFLYIALSFLILLGHFIDFTLVRLMDTSFAYAITFFASSNIDQFWVAFKAMNLNSGMVALMVFSIIALPLVGICLYFLLKKASDKKPLPLKPSTVVFGAALLFLLLFGIAFVAHPSPGEFNRYKKALPLGAPFLSPLNHPLALPAPLKGLRPELPPPPLSIVKKPNLYFFIVETFRNDALIAAPTLTRFGEKNLSVEHPFANANSTAPSVYTLFHATFPHLWTEARDKLQEGAFPLRLLKEMGYEIRVYSSPDLSYFGLDELLLGKKRKLASHIAEYAGKTELLPCDRDLLLFSDLKRDLQTKREKTAFFLFLDTTHSEYAIPPTFPKPFTPALEKIDYLAIASHRGDLPLLKNRYLNAVAFVDSLFTDFFHFLEKENLYEEALIAVTGDHGEEFFEEGALFHGTHLNRWQTSVPILLKVGSGPRKIPLASHVDIFPTLLAALTGKHDWSDYLDGESLLHPSHTSSTLLVQHKGPLPPTEFALTDGNLFASATLSKQGTQCLLLEVKRETHLDEMCWDEAVKEKLWAPLTQICDDKEKPPTNFTWIGS